MSQKYDYDKQLYYSMTIVYDAKSKMFEATFPDLKGFESQFGKTEEEAFNKALDVKKEFLSKQSN